VAAVLFLTFAWVGTASADDAPIQLIPQPPRPPAPNPVNAPIPAGNPLDQPVQVQGLAAVDPNGLGLLDPQHGGLATDLWAASDMNVVAVLLPALPTATPSRALRSLMRRLLLTVGPPPRGDTSGGDSFIAMRARALWAMGDLDSLASLLALIPSSSQSPGMQHIAINLALLKGDPGRACALSQALAVTAPDDIYPAEIGVYCKFATGKPGEAALGIDVLRDQKINDSAFFALADAAANGGAVKLDVLTELNPLLLALSGLGKTKIPPPAPGTLPAIQAAIAVAPNATAEAQLVAAERAESVGALDTEKVRQLYLAQSFTVAELSAARSSLASDPPPRQQAALYRAVVDMPSSAGKADLIAKALKQAGGGAAFFAAARLYEPVIETLVPTPDLLDYARPITRALFAAGRPDLAQGWFDLARAQSILSDQGAKVAASLLPLVRIAQPDIAPITPNLFAAWRKSLPDLPQDKADRGFAIAVSLYSALGEKVPEDAWIPLLAGPSIVSGRALRPALKQILATALANQSLGLTALASLVALGGGDLGDFDPDDLNRLISGLKSIGLESDARAVAMEAALANGL
jgi:hypothetical protein